MTENNMNESITEEEIKKCLTKWFRKEGIEVLPKEKALTQMKYSGGKIMPDVIAYKKRANTVYLIECKRASKLRLIGLAFGQMLSDELSLIKIRRRELQKVLQKNIGKSSLNTLKLSFGLAFPKHDVEIKEIKRMIMMLHQEEPFKNMVVYTVDTINTNVDNSIIKKFRGKQINYKDIIKS